MGLGLGLGLAEALLVRAEPLGQCVDVEPRRADRGEWRVQRRRIAAAVVTRLLQPCRDLEEARPASLRVL